MWHIFRLTTLIHIVGYKILNEARLSLFFNFYRVTLKLSVKLIHNPPIQI